jgi:hypothetical protein
MTGYLCKNTAESFGQAIETVLEDTEWAASMGQEGRKHVQEQFGTQRLVKEWLALTEQTIVVGRERLARAGQYRLARTLIYFAEAFVSLSVCMFLTWALRISGILEPSDSIWGVMRKTVRGDEL